MNYEFIQKNKLFTNGTVIIFNECSHILVNCDFEIIETNVNNKSHLSVFFKNWNKSLFDDDKKHLIETINNNINNKIIILGTYNNNEHPDNLETKIKCDISKRILEFIRIKI